MLTGIDHLVIAVDDPDRAATDLESELGLSATGGGRHESLGTFNRLIWLGDSYVELIGVFDRERAERSWLGRPTIDALERGGGLATFALASDDLRVDVARLRASGSRLADPMPGERARPDGRTVRWLLALPPELGPEQPPFLIEHDSAAAEWTPEDRAERAAGVHPLGAGVRLAAIEIRVVSVAAAGYSYLADLGLRFRPSLAGGGARDTSIGSQIVRLRPLSRPASGEPAVSIRLRAEGATDRGAADPGADDPGATDPGATDRGATLFGCRWLIGS